MVIEMKMKEAPVLGAKGSKKESNVLKNAEWAKKAVPFLGLLVLVLLFSTTTDGRFLKVTNLQNIFSQAAIVMVAGTGCSFVMSHNNLDFSLGGACAMSAVAGIVIGAKFSYAWMLPVCLTVGMMCGLITAGLHIKARIPAFMAGMCIMFAGRGLAQGAYLQFVMTLPQDYKVLQNIWFYFAVVTVIFLAAYILFEYTKIGKYNKLIGSNMQVAKLSGVPVNKYKAMAFAVSGFTVGAAAFMSIIRGGGVGAQTGTNLETNVLLALTLGGFPLTGGSQAKMRSVIVGALVLFMLNNGLQLWGVDPTIINVIKGIVFLVVVYITIDRGSGGVMI